MLPFKFLVNWLFGSGEEAKKQIVEMAARDRNNFSFFLGLQGTPMLSTEFQVNWPFSTGEEVKNSHLRFPIRTILAIFDLQVTPMLFIEFQVNWHFDSG